MPNLRLGGKDAPVASKNSLSSFAFKTASLSVSLKTNLFPFCPSPRFAVDALSADRFLRMIFNLPPEELDTTMHSPGEYIKQAISTESDVRGSSTTNVSATCILRARDSGQNSFDVRRVKLLLQTQPDVYYGCLNGKFFCVPVLVNIHHHHHRAAGEKRVTPILITQYRVPSFDRVASVEIYTPHRTKDDRSSKSVSFSSRRLILSWRGKKSMQLFCRCSLEREYNSNNSLEFDDIY